MSKTKNKKETPAPKVENKKPVGRPKKPIPAASASPTDKKPVGRPTKKKEAEMPNAELQTVLIGEEMHIEMPVVEQKPVVEPTPAISPELKDFTIEKQEVKEQPAAVKAKNETPATPAYIPPPKSEPQPILIKPTAPAAAQAEAPKTEEPVSEYGTEETSTDGANTIITYKQVNAADVNHDFVRRCQMLHSYLNRIAVPHRNSDLFELCKKSGLEFEFQKNEGDKLGIILLREKELVYKFSTAVVVY